MKIVILTAVIVLACCIKSAWLIDRGAQIRMTTKGMQYAAQIGTGILQKEINGKRIPDQSGRSGSKRYSVTSIVINYIQIPYYSVSPKPGAGLSVSVSGVRIQVTGRISLSYKIGWITMRSSASFRADTSGVSFRVSALLGRNSAGHPTVSASGCSANVGSINLHFWGSKLDWLYNIVSGFIEDRLKKELNKIMCDEAVKAINIRGNSELATFPVTQSIDSVATIDYSFVAPARFTQSYMDIFIKAEFKQRQNPRQSSLQMPPFVTSSDSAKMVYFWLSEYAFNSAGEVYHKSGRIALTVSAKDSWIPKEIKPLLNTNTLQILIPQLGKLYPNRPLQLRLGSSKPPTVSINPGSLTLNVFASAAFQVVPASGSPFDIFSLEIDTNTVGTIGLKQGKVVGKVNNVGFNMTVKVMNSKIGDINIPTNAPLISMLVQKLILDLVNPHLQRGFALPTLQEVELIQPAVKFHTNVIRIGTDCKYHG